MAANTRRFAPEEESFRLSLEIGFGIQAQYTHKRSHLEVQPAIDAVGNVLVYDGRLDNYRDLLADLNLPGEDKADSEIILCAYREWGNNCFRRLIGDWALALWDSRSRTLHLARDHAGTRLLHYSRDAAGTVVLATYLDSYVGTSLLDSLDPVYMASYLAMLPCYKRSPYRAIQAILPGQLLTITQRGITQTQFWMPAVSKRNMCGTSRDYEVRFLSLLKQSVARRTGPGAPVLAQLSGGMDSTSIVCVADLLHEASGANSGPIDTLSYFNDSEQTWNERPYFTLVEAKRGRRGFHLDTSLYENSFERPNGYGYLYPGIGEGNIQHDLELNSILSLGGYRSILSGIGGDEFTGGNPNPAAEVLDLLATGMLSSGMRHAVKWCLARRFALVDLFSQCGSFIGHHSLGTRRDSNIGGKIPWLTPIADQYCQSAIAELPFMFFKPLLERPKLADINETWWYTLRTQPHLKPSELYRCEYRYPYLDRDLLEFLFQVPSTQLAQPGRRRLMMRAALKGIVPEEILERRRKAFSLASPLQHIRQIAPRLGRVIEGSLLAEGGFVDKAVVSQVLDATITGREIRWWSLVLRFVGLETWLRYRERATFASGDIKDSAGAQSPVDSVPASLGPLYG